MVKISVIVPVYNAEQYLSECLDSVLKQTYRELEILLVDDGSTDNSLQICQEYAKQDRRIQVLHQENGGSTCARRTGLRAASGEYISFIDSDDWLESCFYEKMYALTRDGSMDIVISGCIMEEGEVSDIRKNNLSEGIYDETALKECFYPQMLYFESTGFFEFGIRQYLWNKLYKKSIIQPCIENLDERIFDGEDVACVFEACLRANAVVVDNHCWYHYRKHENSICTSKKDESYFVNAVYLYNYMAKVFEASEERAVLMPQLKHFICFFINNGMNNLFGCMFIKDWSSSIWTLPEIPPKGSCKIVLYGAGGVGRSYYRQILSMKNVELVKWVDRFASGQKVGGVTIEPPEALPEAEWDYIVLAVQDKAKQKEIKTWLKEHGIEAAKILNTEPEKIPQGYEFWIEEDNHAEGVSNHSGI